MALQVGAYPGVCSMKRLVVFLLDTPPPPQHPPRWNASHHRATPALNSPLPIYTPGRREALSELSILFKNITRCSGQGFNLYGQVDPASGISLTFSPPHLPSDVTYGKSGCNFRRIVYLKRTTFSFSKAALKCYRYFLCITGKRIVNDFRN